MAADGKIVVGNSPHKMSRLVVLKAIAHGVLDGRLTAADCRLLVCVRILEAFASVGARLHAASGGPQSAGADPTPGDGVVRTGVRSADCLGIRGQRPPSSRPRHVPRSCAGRRGAVASGRRAADGGHRRQPPHRRPVEIACLDRAGWACPDWRRRFTPGVRPLSDMGLPRRDDGRLPPLFRIWRRHQQPLAACVSRANRSHDQRRRNRLRRRRRTPTSPTRSRFGMRTARGSAHTCFPIARPISTVPDCTSFAFPPTDRASCVVRSRKRSPVLQNFLFGQALVVRARVPGAGTAPRRSGSGGRRRGDRISRRLHVTANRRSWRRSSKLVIVC